MPRTVDSAQHFHQQAFSALIASAGARAYYDAMKARKIGHHAALRQLASRLVGILHGCLKTGANYNEITAWQHQTSQPLDTNRHGMSTWPTVAEPHTVLWSKVLRHNHPGATDGGAGSMISLTSPQMRRLLVFLDQILVVESFSEISTVLLPALAGLMGATLVKYHYVYRLNEPFSIDIGWPAELFTLSNMAAYARIAHLHPFRSHVDKVMATAPEHPLAVSDVLSMRTWRASQVYREAMRAVGGDDQISMIMGASGNALGLVTLTRCGGTFTDADHQLLFRARGHIAAAARRALSAGAAGAAMQTRPAARWVNLDEMIPEPALGGLSGRELEVLGLVSEGLTSGQIGRRLGISPRTVDKHVEHMYRKVGVGSRAAATKYLLARERGGQLGGSADVKRLWLDQARLILSERPGVKKPDKPCW